MSCKFSAGHSKNSTDR